MLHAAAWYQSTIPLLLDNLEAWGGDGYLAWQHCCWLTWPLTSALIEPPSLQLYRPYRRSPDQECWLLDRHSNRHLYSSFLMLDDRLGHYHRVDWIGKTLYRAYQPQQEKWDQHQPGMHSSSASHWWVSPSTLMLASYWEGYRPHQLSFFLYIEATFRSKSQAM